MIHVLPKCTRYPKTDEGTIIRSAFYKAFANNINQVYDAPNLQGDKVLSGAELLQFLRETLIEIAPSIVPPSLG